MLKEVGQRGRWEKLVLDGIPALLSSGESNSLLGDDATTPQFLDVVVKGFLGPEWP